MEVTEINVTAKLVDNFRIDVDNQRAHTIALDLEPPDGKDMGPSALEVCIMSFAGCYATIFMLTAKKMRFRVKGLEVKVEALKSEEAGTITKVDAHILVDSDLPRDRLQRAHELTVKTCPVGILFEKANVKIKYQLSETSISAKLA